MSADKMPPLPVPFLYAQELIANGGGVWLGCVQKGICEQAHEVGETGDEVINLHKDAEVRAYARAYAAEQTRELVEALKLASDFLREWQEELPEYVGDKEPAAMLQFRALIAKHKEQA